MEGKEIQGRLKTSTFTDGLPASKIHRGLLGRPQRAPQQPTPRGRSVARPRAGFATAQGPATPLIDDTPMVRGFKSRGFGPAAYGSDLATRKPRWPLRSPGPLLTRDAARAYCAPLPHDPPRLTRYEPEPGPTGSVTTPDG